MGLIINKARRKIFLFTQRNGRQKTRNNQIKNRIYQASPHREEAEKRRIQDRENDQLKKAEEQKIEMTD